MRKGTRQIGIRHVTPRKAQAEMSSLLILPVQLGVHDVVAGCEVTRPKPVQRAPGSSSAFASSVLQCCTRPLG